MLYFALIVHSQTHVNFNWKFHSPQIKVLPSVVKCEPPIKLARPSQRVSPSPMNAKHHLRLNHHRAKVSHHPPTPPEPTTRVHITRRTVPFVRCLSKRRGLRRRCPLCPRKECWLCFLPWRAQNKLLRPVVAYPLILSPAKFLLLLPPSLTVVALRPLPYSVSSFIVPGDSGVVFIKVD